MSEVVIYRLNVYMSNGGLQHAIARSRCTDILCIAPVLLLRVLEGVCVLVLCGDLDLLLRIHRAQVCICNPCSDLFSTSEDGEDGTMEGRTPEERDDTDGDEAQMMRHEREVHDWGRDEDAPVSAKNSTQPTGRAKDEDACTYQLRMISGTYAWRWHISVGSPDSRCHS